MLPMLIPWHVCPKAIGHTLNVGFFYLEPELKNTSVLHKDLTRLAFFTFIDLATKRPSINAESTTRNLQMRRLGQQS